MATTLVTTLAGTLIRAAESGEAGSAGATPFFVGGGALLLLLALLAVVVVFGGGREHS